MTVAFAVVAGAAGAVARAAIVAALPRPWGTSVVNVVGAVLLGLAVGAGVDGTPLVIVGTGFLGGFTTFSTWMTDAVHVPRRVAVVAVVGTFVAGVAGAALGARL